MPNVKRLAARLEPEEPDYLYSVSDCGKCLKSNLLSKPSKVYSSDGKHKLRLTQWTRPTHQWEARTGTARPPGQSDAEKVSKNEIPQQSQVES